MKQVFVGCYHIGYDQVDLYLREGTGADTYFTPEKGRLPRMKIGADTDNQRDVVASAVHESFEYVADRTLARFARWNTVRDTSENSYIFMDHIHFDNICAKVGDFLSECLPDLSRAWKEWKKPKPKKRKGGTKKKKS